MDIGRSFSMLAWVPLVFTGTILSGASSQSQAEEAFVLSSVLHSGMVFENLVLPDISPGNNDRQMVRAAIAEVGNPKQLLHIQGLEFITGVPDSEFHLLAPAATFDLQAKRMNANEGFRARGWGCVLEGASLSGQIVDRRFNIARHFEIRFEGGKVDHIAAPFEARELREGLFTFTNARQSLASPPKTMTGVRVLQDFSLHLHGFDKYWRSLSREAENASAIRRRCDWHLVSWRGGELDLTRKKVHMAGAAALIGPGGILASRGGIFWSQEQTGNDEESDSGELGPEARIHGGGGVDVWMEASDLEVTWVRAEAFEYVGGLGNVLQFEGGPVSFCHDGIQLQAEENWQFVRIFEGKRLVLSPGSWKTMDGN